MDQATPKKHDLAALDKIYTEGEQADSDIFSEMRSNLLLISGEHYNRRTSSLFRRIRDSKEINDQQKLRLTKNHIQYIIKRQVNSILSSAPGVGFEPKNESELQDQKVAEIVHSVWEDGRERYNLDELFEDSCDDFLGVGEVHLKVFWDPNGGKLLGHHQATDESGALLTDETGQPAKGAPAYSGEFLWELIQGFNLVRPAECKDMDKAAWNCFRKMQNKEDLIAQFPEHKSKIQEGEDRTIVVFDASRGGYRKTQNEVMIREFYFRSCHQYPNGYFYICTKEVILAEGELPGGHFPIVSQPLEKIPTTPRGRSPVKVMRPYQAEINRAASKMAEHQITLGDDKLLIQNGTKISAGVALPGIRSINYQGAEPSILAGRDGSQYLNYMNSQIEELYRVMGVAEDDAPVEGQSDPYALLFRAASAKRRNQRNIRKFERFLIKVAKLYTKLAQIHLPDDTMIFAIGRKEMVNIKEFRNAPEICYQIKVKPQTDDLETKMGKQLVLNHLVQFTGSQLSPQDIGKLVRLMPYANLEEGLADLTIDYDSGTNMILAIDRGEMPVISPYDEPVYMIKRLVGRARQPDFMHLDPQVQHIYAQVISQYQQIKVRQAQELQAAEAGFIPTDGYMVTIEFYVSDPADPAKTRRARLPYSSIKWLIEKLETQGKSLDEMEKMNAGAQAQMAGMLSQQNAQGGAPQSQGSPPQAQPA